MALGCSAGGGPSVEDLAERSHWVRGAGVPEGTVLAPGDLVTHGSTADVVELVLVAGGCPVPATVTVADGAVAVDVAEVGPDCGPDPARAASRLEGVDGWSRRGEDLELRRGSDVVAVLVPVESSGHA